MTHSSPITDLGKPRVLWTKAGDVAKQAALSIVLAATISISTHVHGASIADVTQESAQTSAETVSLLGRWVDAPALQSRKTLEDDKRLRAMTNLLAFYQTDLETNSGATAGNGNTPQTDFLELPSNILSPEQKAGMAVYSAIADLELADWHDLPRESLWDEIMHNLGQIKDAQIADIVDSSLDEETKIRQLMTHDKSSDIVKHSIGMVTVWGDRLNVVRNTQDKMPIDSNGATLVTLGVRKALDDGLTAMDFDTVMELYYYLEAVAQYAPNIAQRTAQFHGQGDLDRHAMGVTTKERKGLRALLP